MIKAIIFDLGGVLFTNGTKRFINLLSEQYNIDKQLVHDTLDGALGTAYREAKITREEFWTTLIKRLNLTQDIDTLENEWINGYELVEETHQIIQELSKKYKMYYLSDNVKERIDKVNARYNFLEWFSGGVFSHEVGHRKPHPAVYKAALEVAGVKPEEALYIDDKPDLLPEAEKLGMTALRFETPEKLREDLTSLTIL